MRAVVFVEGGEVVAVTCDHPESEIAIVDYSVDKTDFSKVTPDGEPCRIVKLPRSSRRVDGAFVEGVFGKPARKFRLRIRFGTPETGAPVDELEFGSKGERDAYLRGVGDAQGWEDYEVLDGGTEQG